ncbi:helix-turn-helix transcriptional regulator [Geothrix sp. 21YS21S-2]|uniref:helix-turn-helix domain-containing protein n=1 Tax=Geothrix sp. 21YS21S-2 TaxID=3068893 RepID=UPI0027BA0B0D|nr:helix-turn-helix transcriptional regulator [Geothrix sp. 21YS21S-2]
MLAGRAKSLRLREPWTRETLAARAGLTSASLKRFETTGSASLDLVLKVAFALGRLEDFAGAPRPSDPASLADLEARQDLQQGPGELAAEITRTLG